MLPGPLLTRFPMRVHLRSPCQPSPRPGFPAWFGTDLWALPPASHLPVTGDARGGQGRAGHLLAVLIDVLLPATSCRTGCRNSPSPDAGKTREKGGTMSPLD